MREDTSILAGVGEGMERGGNPCHGRECTPVLAGVDRELEGEGVGGKVPLSWEGVGGKVALSCEGVEGRVPLSWLG